MHEAPLISTSFSAFFHKELSHSTVFAQQPIEFRLLNLSR